MKLAIISTAILLAGLASALGSHQDYPSARREHLKPRRKHYQLFVLDLNAQPHLPTLQAAISAAEEAGLNLDNIQGNLPPRIGMKKELFYFFGIAHPADFKSKLATQILPLITTTTQLLRVDTQPITAINIGFSQTGLIAMNITESLNDPLFSQGQFAGLKDLGDRGPADWVPEFAGTTIHGVLPFASDTEDNISNAVSNLESTLGDTITKIYSLKGASRPGSEEGHEHFGFQDGISNPAIIGFTADPKPGKLITDPDAILLNLGRCRPAWSKEGSFLAFRQLKQFVPEFNKYLADNALEVPGLSAQQGSDLLGARVTGRWKSGTPIDLSPLFDDPELGANASRNNDFNYAHPGENIRTDQSRCPFGAHLRKVRPRAAGGIPEETVNTMMRAGIPYRPEVGEDEAASDTTSVERGLAFVSYQSDLSAGFAFIQQHWSDDEAFPIPGTGLDALIGRPSFGKDPNTPRVFADFVISRGGEYFFTPSLSAIATIISV
ncbi:fungal peroxidase [Mycena rebaudengoi]|nr:fungal peroxidase [Mycena rebaudengoi]